MKGMSGHLVIYSICNGVIACIPISGLLFSKFRFGWKISLHAIPQKQSSKPSLQTFLVVAGKESSMILHQITTSISHSSLSCDGSQVDKVASLLINFDQLSRKIITHSCAIGK